MLNRLIPFLAGRFNYGNFQVTGEAINEKGAQIVDYLIIAGFSIVTASGIIRILQAVVRHDNRGAGKEAVDHLFAYIILFLFMIGMHAVRRYFG